MSEISGKRQYEFLKKFDYIREAGTEAEEKAAQTILEELSSFHVEGHLEEFPIQVTNVYETKFFITEPYAKEYRASGYLFSGSTPENGIEAPFLYAENGDDISLSAASGKIVMVNGTVRKEMYQKLVKAGAVGFVTITGTPIDEGVDLEPTACTLRGVKEPSIQGLSIHYKDAVEIVENGASRALMVVLQKAETHTSRNVVARIPGTDKASEILTLTAHFDSVPQGPGAYDNMAGGAIILELCRYFQEYKPRRSLEFVWFGAEEKGLLGSQAYVKEHEAELSRHQFNMNVDLAGQLVGGTVIGITGGEEIAPMMRLWASEIGIGIGTKTQIWGSDSNTFAYHGIPAMTLNRDGFGMHTRHDRVELLSPWSLERSARLLGHIAEALGNIEVIPFKREVPEELVGQLKGFFEG